MWTDSTATIGICGRDGLGKLRHIDTQCLWLQHQVRSDKVEVCKIKGTENPADIFTKHLPGNGSVQELLKLFGCEVRDGRPSGAPTLRSGQGGSAGESLACVETAYARGSEVDRQAYLQGEIPLMSVGERHFPAVWWEDGWVPEARPYRQDCSPHQAPNNEDYSREQ